MKSKFYSGPSNGSKRELDASDAKIDEISTSNAATRKDLLDSSFIAHLVEMMKLPSLNLQRKAATVLEFLTIIDTSMETIISTDIASGLDAVFQHKVLSEVREASVVELNRIISEGAVDATRTVASAEGILPLVKPVEEGSERSVEAAISILYNLSMEAIITAGVVPALRKIVLSQKPQWKRALHLLRSLPA